MFVSNLPVTLNSKTVIEDLSLRSGAPDSESVCPFEGQFEFVSAILKDFNGSTQKLIMDIKDFDVDITRPDEGTHAKRDERDISSAYDPVDNTNPGYVRRFEDLDESWAEKYCKDMIYGKAFVHNKGGVKEYTYNNREQYAMRDVDSDKVVTQSNIASVKYNDSNEIRAREQLPYYIKKIYEKGKELGVHTISLIIAYEKASQEIEIQNRYKSYQSSVSIQNLLSHPVYEQKSDGSISRQFDYDTGRTNKKVKLAFDWVRGLTDDTRVYPCIQEFIVCLATLGVDIKKEDPLVYNEEFINGLCCTYITSNREYLFGCKGVNYQVLSELQNISLDTWLQRRTTPEVVDEATLIASTMQKWSDLNVEDVLVPDLAWREFYHYYMIMTGMPNDYKSYVSEKGIYEIKRGIPVFVDISRLNMEDFRIALVSTTGMLLAVTADECLHVISIGTAVDYMKQLLGVLPYSKDFGSWEVIR